MRPRDMQKMLGLLHSFSIFKWYHLLLRTILMFGCFFFLKITIFF